MPNLWSGLASEAEKKEKEIRNSFHLSKILIAAKQWFLLSAEETLSWLNLMDVFQSCPSVIQFISQHSCSLSTGQKCGFWFTLSETTTKKSYSSPQCVSKTLTANGIITTTKHMKQPHTSCNQSSGSGYMQGSDICQNSHVRWVCAWMHPV